MMPGRRLVTGMTAAGVSVVLSACGGATSASLPAARSSAARPAVSSLTSAIAATVTSATGVHVSGIYTRPGFTARVSLNLRAAGQFAGTIFQGKVPVVVIRAGGKLYEKITPGLLRLAHKPGACPALCGKYVAFRPSAAAAVINIVGMTATESLLSAVVDGFSTYTITTYGGQRAYRVPLTDLAPGATAYIAATATCDPLAINDPGVAVLTFSRWNDVPQPVAPPVAQIVPNVPGSRS